MRKYFIIIPMIVGIIIIALVIKNNIAIPKDFTVISGSNSAYSDKLRIKNENINYKYDDFATYGIRKYDEHVYVIGVGGIYHLNLETNEIDSYVNDFELDTLSDTTELVMVDSNIYFNSGGTFNSEGHYVNELCKSDLNLNIDHCIGFNDDLNTDLFTDGESIYASFVKDEVGNELNVKKYDQNLQEQQDFELGNSMGNVAYINNNLVLDFATDGLYIHNYDGSVEFYDNTLYKGENEYTSLAINEVVETDDYYYLVCTDDVIEVNKSDWSNPKQILNYKNVQYVEDNKVYYENENNNFSEINLSNREVIDYPFKVEHKSDYQYYYIKQ